jgi:hypothetical protein
MTDKPTPTDAELQSIIDDADAGPPTDKEWLCLECGRWTPWRHEEAHDHADGCKAPAIYAAKRDWKTRLKDYMAKWGIPAAPAQPAAQQGAAYAATPTSNYAGRVYEEGFLIGTCPLYTADQLRAFADATYALRASHGQAPATEDSVQEDAARPDIDAAFEATRRCLCKIPRYSFALDSRGNVRRCEDKSGNWIEFDAAHALFDPVSVDAARKQGDQS